MSVTLVSPAKTAEPIEMPFARRTRVGRRNHVLDRVKVRRIHLPPRGVTGWRDGLSSKFFDHFFSDSISWCLAEGYRNEKSAPTHGVWLGEDFTFSPFTSLKASVTRR